MKTFAIYQLVGFVRIEITWIAAFDENDALIKAGCFDGKHIAIEV